VDESKIAVVAAFLGNAALATLKAVGAVATGSAAMLAETFHSIADTGNQALLFLGMHLARRPPDRVHPFGHGKNVYFWAFVVSLMLFTVGGASSIWEAIRKFSHPVAQQRSAWAYAVLGGAFVFEAVSLTIALHSLRRATGARPLGQYWRETRDPTLLTVLFEDSAALVSLVIAGAGVWLTERTGNPVWDSAASAGIGVLLLGVATMLAFENYSLLIGESAPEPVEAEIRVAVTTADAGVVDLAALQTMHLGPRSVLVIARVRFRDDMAAPAIQAAVARLHRAIDGVLQKTTRARFIAIEPVGAGPPLERAA
jgi:cation diffusion facilitator family transporter